MAEHDGRGGHQSPTAKVRRMAGILRALREHTNMTVTDAAKAVSRNQGWLSRIEHCKDRIHPNDVLALLRLYKTEDAVVEAVMELAKQARVRGWWLPYNSVLDHWFRNYVGLETDATFIRVYEPQVVHGLLQTEAYARAIIGACGIPDRSSGVDKTVQLRLARQKILVGEQPPQFRVVLDEGVLRRPTGGRKIMHEQVEALLEASERPNIEIQVLRLSTGAHAGLNGSFAILDFPPTPDGIPNAADDRLVYTDDLLGAHYFEEPAEIAAYSAVFEQLRADSLSAEGSRKLLRSIAKDLASQ
ncbi:MAG: helix-turn-helix transcriptional regulator [Actinocatenispora sp.]